MINFYKLYNKVGLDKEEYDPLFDKLDEVEYTNDLELIAHIIKKDSWYAYRYARYVMKGRWVEAEPYIMKTTCGAYYYARRVINGRWKEAEPCIMEDPDYAYSYARYVINGRWLEAEPIIEDDGAWWGHYCGYFKL